MGGPMSSLIAEVFMDRLECWVLNRYQNSGNILLWYRYVDDILCLWPGPIVIFRSFIASSIRLTSTLSSLLKLETVQLITWTSLYNYVTMI